MGAIIDGDYRYVLWRQLGERARGRVLWVMLNPSTADAETNDATVRKVMGFSTRWGFSEARIVNLYALRSRDPKALKTHPAPIGPLNDSYIASESAAAEMVVTAWGQNAELNRAVDVLRILQVGRDGNQGIFTLGRCGGVAGHPKHPLMLGYDTRLDPF
jgi:hypothetical protein